MEDVSLKESIERLRAIPGELHKIKDPLKLLHIIRHGPDAVHGIDLEEEAAKLREAYFETKG